MWTPEIKQIESVGWKLEKEYDFGFSYYWLIDSEYYNRPTLFIRKPEFDGYYSFHICKFDGQNDWYGKMQLVFKGRCNTFDDFKLVCDLIDLNDYKKFKK